MQSTFVLIHSPLVGPTTWSLVADLLRQRGIEAIVPTLSSNERGIPYWKQHAMDVVNALESTPSGAKLVLVGHSGAGPLLPAVRQLAERSVSGYVFVDAGIPVDGMSHLDLRALESAEFAARFRQTLQEGERFPTWSEDDLCDIIPDAALRTTVVSEIQPRSLDFFDEPIPVLDGWPDAPCAYIQFTSTYDVFAQRARSEGWTFHKMEGDHFHMLVDPEAVATALLRAVKN